MKKETTMIRFGTNPIAWANDDDQSIGKDIPTKRILQEAGRLIGFDGIENGHRWPEDPVELRETLGAYGLKFISGWYSTELLTRSIDDKIATLQQHLAKLKAGGFIDSARKMECEPGKRGAPPVFFFLTSSEDAFASVLSGETVAK